MAKLCRKCSIVLVLGKNWSLGRQKDNNYICSSCLSAYDRSYRKEHKQQRAIAHKRWREANREKYVATNRRWAVANRDRVRAHSRRWRATNLERARVQYRQATAKRRAQIAGVLIGLVSQEMIFQADGYRCVYCGAKSNLVLDHVVPLAKGGAHIEENLVTACAPCDWSKGAKSLIVWLAQKWVEGKLLCQ